MRKFLLFALVGVFAVTSAWAQKVVTGTVYDGDETVPMANVIEVGTNNGVTSDLDGNFTIEIKDNGSIEVSSIGLKAQVFKAADINGPLTVKLTSDALKLEGFVMTGYSMQKKEDVSGAITSVTGDDLKNSSSSSIDGALQGKVAGLNVVNNSGAPGNGLTIRVRGASSIGAGNDPLYVIDGVAVTTGDFGQLSTGGQNFSAIADLNPNDIEDIQVLKDASATAIYGSRASNGVVLITTKSGKAGKSKVNFGTYYGRQAPIKRLELLNAEQYKELYDEAVFNTYGLEDGTDALGLLGEEGVDTDWLDLVLQTAEVKNYDLSVSGGDLKTKYYLGGSLFDQEGTVIGQRFQRASGRLNVSHVMSDKLSFNVRISATKTNQNFVESDNNIYGSIPTALLQSPRVSAYDSVGNYNYDGMFFAHPVATALAIDRENENNRMFGNFDLTYKILDGLSFRTKAGIDLLHFRDRQYNPVTTNRGAGSDGSATQSTSQAQRVVTDQVLTFNRVFGKVNLNALAGTAYEVYKTDRNWITAETFPNPTFRYITSAAEITGASNFVSENRLLSYFTRWAFDIDNRYLVQLNLRADGSSKFGENNRFGYFPSASLGWVVSEEGFMSDVTAISNLKLRVSYGVTGNQAGIGNFAARGLAGGGFPYGAEAGVFLTQIANPDLRWEQTAEANYGLDLALFNSRLSLNADYFIKNTTDLLLARPLPYTTGFASITENVGEVKNWGWELAINSQNVTGEFNWTSSLTLSKVQNEIIALVDSTPIDYGFANRNAVGHAMSEFWMIKSLGVDPETGNMIYEDVNGDGVINSNDDQFVGTPWPNLTGGLTNNFSYKGIDLNVFFQFSEGNQVYNATRRFTEDLGATRWNNTTGALERWRKPGDVTDVPQAYYSNGGPATAEDNPAEYNRLRSTRFLEDGSYIRLKSMSLGYSLPESVLGKVGMERLRFYIAGDNLMTWTNYSGADPEVNFGGSSSTTLGTDFLTQGLFKSVKFGLNATF